MTLKKYHSIYWPCGAVLLMAGLMLMACCAGCKSSGNSGGGSKGLFASKKSKYEEQEKDITVLLADGNRAMGSRRYHEARGHYLKILEIYDKNPGIQKNPLPYCQMGIISEELKMYPEAEGYYRQAIALDETQPEPYNSLGYCMFRQQKYDEAIEWIEKAVELRPAGSKYLNNLALVYGSKENYPKAFQYFRLAGTEADAYYNMSTIFAMQGKNEEAQESLRHATRLDPSHKDANRMLMSYTETENDLFDSPTDFYDYQKRGLVEYHDTGAGLGGPPNVEPVTAGYTRQYGSSHQISGVPTVMGESHPVNITQPAPAPVNPVY